MFWGALHFLLAAGGTIGDGCMQNKENEKITRDQKSHDLCTDAGPMGGYGRSLLGSRGGARFYDIATATKGGVASEETKGVQPSRTLGKGGQW